MKCPYCDSTKDRVIDSRTIRGGAATRRRRECLKCHKRFTSYEQIEQIELQVIKKNGRLEPYDRNKIWAGLKKACEKRPVSNDTLEAIIDKIENAICNGKTKVSTREIGEAVMKALSKLDEIAYVRFASVYRQFKDTSEFMEELKSLLTPENKDKKTKKKPKKTKPDQEKAKR
ncbi:MAG: transcriptional regulator NrdR [bacterium]